jgi:hypothetical protein
MPPERSGFWERLKNKPRKKRTEAELSVFLTFFSGFFFAV